MEVTSSSQAASSSPSLHHGSLGSSHTLPHSIDDQATGGEEGDDILTQADNGIGQSSGHYIHSSAHAQHNISLNVAVPSSSLTLGVLSSSPGADGDNLNNAVDVGGPGMELVRYGPAYPPMYSSESMGYSKDIRDSKAVHGSCGLYNLGNTCFMNAGLQSLMSCAPLVKYFCESYTITDCNRHSLTAHFHLLLCKIWSGQFSVVHPRKFKDFLGMYHSQFEDYRQHDCQEFLALLLDTLHEQLNKAAAGMFPGLSSPRPLPLADLHAGATSSPAGTEPEDQPSHESSTSFVTLNNKDQVEESCQGSDSKEPFILSERGPPSPNQHISVVASSIKIEMGPERSPLSPLSEDSPTSEVSMLESVMTSPSSQADSASSSKSPERSMVPNSGEKGNVVAEEEDEAISSSYPTLQRHISRSHLDDVTSSDSGVLQAKPSLKRVSSGSSMSASCGQLVLHSEDSNHSSLSAHSTDSEQSSAFKRLKIEAAELGKNSSSNNSSNLKECVTSSSDCSKKVQAKKNLALADLGVCPSVDLAKGKVLREADGGGASVDMSSLHDLTVIDNIVSSCQNTSVCSSNLVRQNEAKAMSRTPKRGADSASAATQQSVSPLHLSCLDDFYCKETKTLNTNVQVSEFLQEITSDSEKFAKMDNRNRPPVKEVNILQEVVGEENKTEKVLIGETLGSGVKENNLYAQTSNASVVKPCKNVDLNVVHNSLGDMPPETQESPKLSCVSQLTGSSTKDKFSAGLLKSVDSVLVSGTSNASQGFKCDEEEKNVQMQAYSKFNTIPARSNIRVDISNTLPETEGMEVDEMEMQESSDEDDLEPEAPSHTSTVEACSSVPNCLRHSCPLSEVKMATSAWEEYHARNDSVVVNTFQGQFRSTVVCSECSHVSVTYEPFMYLSLPIPHAMDQQLCVTYISEHKPPVKYLLNLLKTDKVSAAKFQVNQLLGRPVDEDMIVAEVLDSHISRILDNNVLLKYVNTFNRKIYAFEIITSSPSSSDISTNNPDGQEDAIASGSQGHPETSPSRLRFGPGGARDCPETSNQSFDSVMVNSPGSRDTLEGMLSDSEGCEADFLAFPSSTQPPPASSVFSRFPVDSGDGEASQCLPTSSAETLAGNSWFMGDCVGASRLPCTYDEDYDKEDDDADNTLISKNGGDGLALESGSSNKISSSSPLVEASSPADSVKDVADKSASLARFWIDESDNDATEKTKMMLNVDEDNEADASPSQNTTLNDPFIDEDKESGKGDISTTDAACGREGGFENQLRCNNFQTSSSTVPLATATTTVSSSSNNNRSQPNVKPLRDQVSSSQSGRTSSTVHSSRCSPGHDDLEIPVSHGINLVDTVTSCSGSGHPSRLCPSPTKHFSESKGHQEEEATLLGAAAKLGENPGSYFLQSRRLGEYEEEDFYSDQGEGSTYKEEGIESDHTNADSKKDSEPECKGPDWPNTFPVHNFTTSTIQQGALESMSDQWKSCAICLEDLLDSELLTHVMCDGVFCQNCLEMSVKHTVDVSAFSCPICLHPANMCEDFVPLASASDAKPKIRMVQICLAFRRSVKDNTGTTLLQLFGHPNIIHLPSATTGQALYSLLDGLVSPFVATYSVLLTDGQGLRCSRCPYSAHCTGCQVSREAAEVTLQPSDCLTVHIGQELTTDQLTDLQLVHDDGSMAGLRSSEPTTIMDCFGAFTQSELLDEHNPWFCPRCERNQCAKKTMTVWRYPDNLIIHLKRFVYQDLSSTKVDAKVLFPHEGMDVRGFLSGPSTAGLLYDLHSIVCHMGGASAGHYTCYARHPVTHQWHYYNDETVLAQDPGETEFTSGYVLFYQRQGTDVEFTIPENNPCLEEDQAEGSSLITSGVAIPLGPPPSSSTLAIPSSCSGNKGATTTSSALSSSETAVPIPVPTDTPQDVSVAAVPSSSSFAGPDNGNDDEDDYDNEQRCLPCDDDDDDTALTVHFGSSFPTIGEVSSAHDDAEEDNMREEAGEHLRDTEESRHSFMEPDSTFGFM